MSRSVGAGGSKAVIRPPQDLSARLDGVPEFVRSSEVADPKRAEELIRAAKKRLAGEPDDQVVDDFLIFKAMQACVYLSSLHGHKPRRRGPLRDYQGLYQEFASHLVREHMGLVFDSKRRFNVVFCDEDEIFSAGNYALYRAICRFNPWSGFRFSTYACTAITHGFVSEERKAKRRAAIQKNLLEQARPENLVTEGPPVGEPLSEQVRDIIEEGRAELTDIEQFILSRRFLHASKRKTETLESVGRIINLSRERVRQLQESALAKIRALIGEPT